MSGESPKLTFWEHLDELRGVLLRIVVFLVGATVLMFCFKDTLFYVVLAPSRSDFVLYRLLARTAQLLDIQSFSIDNFSVALINTELTGQFMSHLRVALYASLIFVIPFALWQIFRFIAPALYQSERKPVTFVFVFGQLLFLIGVLLNYFLIFPLSFRFLAMYQVDTSVDNMIQLSSYIDTFSTLSLMMGILFEIPLVSIMLARLGVVTPKIMSYYRRHAVLTILVVAAIITPTTDIFTLIMVALPIWLLYELSIVAVRIVGRRKASVSND